MFRCRSPARHAPDSRTGRMGTDTTCVRRDGLGDPCPSTAMCSRPRRKRRASDISTARSGADRAYRIGVQASGALTLGLMALIGLFLVDPIVDGAARRRARLLHPLGVGAGRSGSSACGPRSARHRSSSRSSRSLIAVPGRRSAPRCSSPSTRRARLRRPLTSFIDVLAAIPSLIYGLWGRGVPAAARDPR